MGEQTDFCRRLHTGAFSPWLHNHFDRDFRQLLNHDRIEATVGPAKRRKGAGMDCPICMDLKRAYEAGLSEYIEARSSVCFRACTRLAARKNVEMERARYEVEEHRLVCVSAVRVFARLPAREVSTSLRPLAA